MEWYASKLLDTLLKDLFEKNNFEKVSRQITQHVNSKAGVIRGLVIKGDL